MMRVYSVAIIIFSALCFASPSQAMSDGQFRLGLLAGTTVLMNDVASQAGSPNALGYGVMAGYSASEEMFFNFSYSMSDHSNVTHNDLSLGVDFYLANYDAMYVFASAGASFLGNSITVKTDKLTGSAFGLYGGIGFDFEVGKHMILGLEGKYHKGFETSQILNGVTYKTVQDNATVFLRAAYVFGGSN